MDPLTVSPSWTEHCSQLLPGFGFVDFDASDNDASESDEFFRLIRTNLQRALELPFGPFASVLAFQADLQSFIDTFLQNRRRLSRNPALLQLDVNVFALFFRFVTEVPSNLKFSPATKTSSLAGLHVLTASRLLGLLALFIDPRVHVSPMHEILKRWIKIIPTTEKDLSKVIQTWSASKSAQNDHNAAALRALFNVMPQSSPVWFKALGGVRGHFSEAFGCLSNWYAKPDGSESERGNILQCAYDALVSLGVEHMDAFLESIMDVWDEGKLLLADLLRTSDLKAKLLKQGERLKVDITRIEYACLLIESFATSKNIADREYDIKQIQESTMHCATSDSVGRFDEEAKREDRNQSLQNDDDAKIAQVRELAPHLGRYFAERLLDAWDWNVEKAVSSVFDGSIPPQLAGLDFSLEEEQLTSGAVKVLPAGPSSEPQVLVRDTTDRVLETGVDADIRARIAAFYDKYEDEYDDTLDGGGRVKVDTGAMMLEEDDDEKTALEEEEEGPQVPKKSLIAGKPAFVPRAILGPARPAGSAAKASAKDSQDKRKSQHGSGDIERTKRDPRAMIAVVERHSVVDVNGERRNAQGELVDEDVLMRPNLNRTRAAPDPLVRAAAAEVEAKAKLTPEEEAERLKRERARKERRGNQTRERGADRKLTKAGI